MRTGAISAFVIAILLAGCASPETTPGAGPVPGEADGVEPETLDSDALVAAEPAVEAGLALIPISGRLDGRLEPGARVCQMSVGTCNELRPTPDDQELFIPDLTGTLVAGNATLSWEPASELTRELRLTVFWVPACEDCGLVFIGGDIAPGPFTVQFEAPLELDGGSIWAYSRAPYANSVEDVYVQNDFQQEFTLEVEGLIQPNVEQ